MTDNELKILVASIAEGQKKTDAQLKRTDAQLKRTDAQLAKTSAKVDKVAEMYGGMANNQGDVAEEFFVNALKKNPIINGIAFDTVIKQLNARSNGVQDEFDIVLTNGVALFIIEVKYKAHAKDIENLIKKKSKNFALLFPQYKNYKTYLGLATFCINDDLKNDALSQGVTLLQQQGELITSTAGAIA